MTENAVTAQGIATDPGAPDVTDQPPGRDTEDVLEALRDVVDPELGVNVVDLGLIYGVALVGQIVMWLWWQRRGKRAAVPAIEKKSAYGRPLVRGT